MGKKVTEEKTQNTIELTAERQKRTRSGASCKRDGKLDDEKISRPVEESGIGASNSSKGNYDNEDNEAAGSDSVASTKKKTVRRITLGSVLLVIFMVFYIPSLFNWLSGATAAQDVIRNGIIEEYISAEAVIVREEELLEPSPIDGRYIAEINEGEKTAAFSRITMVTGKESDRLLKDIENINEKIVKARMEQVEKSDFFSADLAKLDEEIGLKVQELIIACNAKSFADMGKQRAEIRKIVEKKAEIVAGDSTDGYISSLQQQKESIQRRINENTKQIISTISGIVSYKIDGYENVLKPDTIKEISEDELSKIIELNKVVSSDAGKVQKGLPFAKIIKGTDIYIVANIPSDKADVFEEGKTINLRINNSFLEASGVVTYINNDGSDMLTVMVRISRGVDILSDQRVVRVDFITKTKEGLKVPLKCLRDITPDRTRGRIMLVRSNVTINRDVEILCSDEEYAIIRTPENEFEKTVDLYNIYIINPDNIEEGDIVGR